jgi:ribonuclease J
MVEITIYGGVGEVGGNQVFVSEGKSRILLDFGTRMGFDSDYFSDFLAPRTNTELKDRLALGALPAIHGIYNSNLFEPIGADALKNDVHKHVLTRGSRYFSHKDLQTYDEYLEKHGKPFVDALFVSHAHLDHVGDISFLAPAIPLFCTKATKEIIETIDEVTAFKTEALAAKVPRVDFYKKEGLEGMPKIKKDEVSRACSVMADGGSFTVGNMKVTLIEVDHSVPGAASFIVEAGGKKVLYTGDIRFHGTMPMTIDEYAKKIGGGVDAMVCEGTRVDSDRKLTEMEIREKIADKISMVKSVVFVDFGWKDTTRYETVLAAAKKAGRILVINAKLAYLLYKLDKYPGKNEPVRVFLKRGGSSLYSPKDYDSYELGLPGATNCHYENGILADEIRAKPVSYVMMFSYYDLGQLFDLIDDDGKLTGSWFIKAQCEPFSDEMELDEERLITWLNKFGIGFDIGITQVPAGCINRNCEKLRERIDRSHVSGHASRPELKELIGKLAPKVLIPVHTNDPGAFLDIARELSQGGGPSVQVILPVYGQSMSI